MNDILHTVSSLGGVIPIDYAWIIQVFIVVFVALVINFFANRFMNKLQQKFEKTSNIWDDLFLDAARKPISAFIWAQGLLLAFNIVNIHSTLDMAELIDVARRSVVIILIAWFLLRFIRGMELRLTKPGALKKPLDLTTAKAISKLLKASTIITTALVLLQTLGFSVSGVLAFGGVGGIAVGFAARDLLANFFGALVIYLDRPFVVGDWIRSPDREIEGTVEEIGWRLTRIRTFDQRPLYVPNAVFASIAVENPSRMFNRRINETIGIRYSDADKMPAIIEKVRQFLIDHPDMETENRTLIVNFNTYGPSSLQFFIYTFTKTTNWVDYHGIKQNVLLGIYDIISNEGADIAFPTQTLYLHEDSASSALGQVEP
ncbi:mechanosensitive ion channel family protein [Marinospirillum insulare]|uniref:Mechanosensitive ion channel protein MscS n=1 Tax=Marinospirillum insulare TaxID=217169 RepID=A0ABQ6A0D1_9GAMM|nr:mechanosensitive ion channel family protein [Marinospirillum insulare]GLR64707.1 mechanosensitive ion channel protein MscS [Marinospirillum insulare]